MKPDELGSAMAEQAIQRDGTRRLGNSIHEVCDLNGRML
jgi:hypothetical protein